MQLKFITLNIWRGNLLSKIIAFLKEEGPDICVMQEVFNGSSLELLKNFRSFSLIKQHLGYPHGVFGPAFLDVTTPDHVENGNALFSKYPILSHQIAFYDVPYGEYMDVPEKYEFCPRNLQHAVIEVNSERLNVFNTHGIYGLEGKDHARRLHMSQTIVDAIKAKQNVILAGDFNLPPNTKTIRNVEKHLTNVFKDELVTTFNMKRKDNQDYGKVVVDMIFVSKNIKVLEHYCPKVDISDHFPLVCALEF